MKRFMIGLVVLVTLTGLAKFGGQYIGANSAVDFVQKEARQQHMPSGFFGVKWLASTEELQSIRRNLVPDADGMLAELGMFLNRQAKISYYVKTGNVLMFAITFTAATSDQAYQKTNQELDRDYGPLSVPQSEKDEYGPKYCSHRKSERFGIDHCVRLQGQVPLESIVFYRSKTQPPG